MFVRLILITLISLFAIPTIAEIVTFECDYPTYSDKEGKHIAKEFQLTLIWDTTAKKAYLRGNSGSTELAMLPHSEGVNFLELTGTGNLTTTTVLDSGESVHSRNSAIFGSFVASQYYGNCLKL
jgi:hypothetical protein